jgi:hypothetical protein
MQRVKYENAHPELSPDWQIMQILLVSSENFV